MTFKYLTPASSEGGQDIAIALEEMVFDFSPGLLTTVSNVVTALTGQQKVAVSNHLQFEKKKGRFLLKDLQLSGLEYMLYPLLFHGNN